MSPGLDFQESFLLLYSSAINLVLGLTLAGGILFSLILAIVRFTEPKREQSPEIGDE